MLTVKFLNILVTTMAMAIFAVQSFATGFVLDDKPGGGKYPIGGLMTFVQGSLGVVTAPYSFPLWNPTEYGAMNYSDGPITLGGDITYKYHWAGSTGSIVPKQALLEIFTEAYFHNYAPNAGAANDSFNTAIMPIPFGAPFPWYGPGGVSWSKQYVVVDVVNGGFEYKLNPSASSDLWAGVGVIMRVHDVYLNVDGTKTMPNGDLKCLVGQKQTASLSIEGFSVHNQVWKVRPQEEHADQKNVTRFFSSVVTGGPPIDNPDFPKPGGGSTNTSRTTNTFLAWTRSHLGPSIPF